MRTILRKTWCDCGVTAKSGFFYDEFMDMDEFVQYSDMLNNGTSRLAEASSPTFSQVSSSSLTTERDSWSECGEPSTADGSGGDATMSVRKTREYRYNPKPLHHKIHRNNIPEDMKDTKYWSKRQKNNLAAKKSREERRRKELEVFQRLTELSQENAALRARLKEADLKNTFLEEQIHKMMKPS